MPQEHSPWHPWRQLALGVLGEWSLQGWWHSGISPHAPSSNALPACPSPQDAPALLCPGTQAMAQPEDSSGLQHFLLG